MNGHDFNDREADRDRDQLDHWEMYAEAMDLTIEGHRLIAQEIIDEIKAGWRGAMAWLHKTTSGRSSPPA